MRKKIFFTVSCISLFVAISMPFIAYAKEKSPITIGARNNALTAAIHYFSAQKNCQIDEMNKFSLHILNEEYNEQTCRSDQLVGAEVTDYIIVSTELALVSSKLEYADKIVVQTSPVVKNDGKWKLVVGINDHHPFLSSKKIKPEIVDGINRYLTSIKTANQKGIETYGKKLDKEETKQEGTLNSANIDSFEYEVVGVKMVADAVAIASIETKVNEKLNEQKYVIYLEGDTWKVISDRYLITAAIPKNENPVEVD